MSIFRFFEGTQPPLVDQAFNDVKKMLSNAQNMFAAATAHLLDNEILDVDLAVLDQEINKLEQDLRRSVLEHLTIDPERELVFSLKLISIVHEAERIGDLAKSLGKVAGLAQQPRMGERVGPLRDIRDRILVMFERTQVSFAQVDEKLARELMGSHERLKADVTNYLDVLARNDEITPNEGVVYALTARMMSRVSSHLANIASTVVCPFDKSRRAPTWPEGVR